MYSDIMYYIWASSCQSLFMPYANNKGADQPAHPRSLISTFVVRFLGTVQYLYLLKPNFKTPASHCS